MSSIHSGHKDQEEEVIPAIRQDDADWKVIQQNTFTRWVNNHLKKAGDSIHNLETDFADGLKLINLAMALSGRNVGKFNKKVNFRSQKLENVSLALNFFQEEEHIKIINIDSTHIVDQNKKLILGLIWTLILHYSISMGWIAEKKEGQQEETPKQKLLNWIRGKLPPGMPVTNFTSDWNDGIALGALVNGIAPGAVPGWEDWTPDDAQANTQKAMKAAQDHLGIAPLITANELIHPEIDEMSVMTYLSQLPSAVQQPKAVAKPIPTGEFHNVEEFPTIHQPSEFEVSVSEEGLKPKITLKDPSGSEVHTVVNKIEPNRYHVKYTPTKIGPHKLNLDVVDVGTGEKTAVPSAAKDIQVRPSPRLLPYPDRVQLGDRVPLRVEDAFDAPVEIVVVDANGNDHALPVSKAPGNGIYVSEYVPENVGLHSINVFHKKKQIPGSPFPLRSLEKNNFTVWGRGTCPDGVRIGDKVPIHVDANDAHSNLNDADLKVEVLSPDGTRLPVKAAVTDDKATFDFVPDRVGDYKVKVLNGDDDIGQSPYTVNVQPKTASKIRAFGPGLEGGVTDQPSVFNVETNGEADHLAFSIEGPSKTDIVCQDRGHGAALVSYTPNKPGIYKVNVLAGGEHIKDSPFVLEVQPADANFHPSAAKVIGFDSNKNHAKGEPIVFRVDTKLAGANLTPEVKVVDREAHLVPVSMREITPGLFECTFTPQTAGRHNVNVNVRGVAVNGSPFSTNIREPVDASKLRLYGPGVEGPVVSQEPTHFTIDAKQAGPGAVEVALTDRQGRAVDIDVLDNTDGSFTVKYTAPRPGAYQLNVVFAGDAIPPIEINVKPQVNVAGIRVEGLENADALVGHRVNVKVDTGNEKPQKRGVEFIAEFDGKEFVVPLVKTAANKHEGTYTAGEPKTVVLKILFDNVPVKTATLNIAAGTDETKCRAAGSGLRSAVVDIPARFEVDTQGAGEGALSIEIRGPAEAATSINEDANGLCTVSYVPTESGEHEIAVRFGDERKQIPGSPFHVQVDYASDPSTIVVHGLENAKPRVGLDFAFSIDASKTKNSPVTVRLPPGHRPPRVSETKRSRVYDVHFVPEGQAGDVLPVEVFYEDTQIHGSPYLLKLQPTVDPEELVYDKREASAKAQHECALVVDTRSCGKVDEVRAEILGPDGEYRECSLQPTENPEVFELLWTTDLPGDYQVLVYINGERRRDPIIVNAPKFGKAEDIKSQTSLPSKRLELGVQNSVSYSYGNDDPNGRLVVRAKRPDAVECTVVRDVNEDGTFADTVHIRPLKPGPNRLRFFYGGEQVDEIEYEALTAEELVREREAIIEHYDKQYHNGTHSTASTEEVDKDAADPKALFTREFKFNFDSQTFDASRLEAFVTMPSNKVEQAQIIDNNDGTILVKYTPRIHGSHELSILQNGVQVQGTPIKFFVDTYADGYATVYGPGLTKAVPGEPAAFTVCAKGSHAKELSVSIEGPGQSKIKIHDNKDGTCAVTWTPPVAGEYKVHVKLGDQEVRESPFKVIVAGEEQKRSHLSVGSTSEVALNISQKELKGITASIRSPSGIEEPCFVRLIDGGRLGVSFTPRESGEHLISVKRDGKLLPKAPFKIKVDKSQVGDPSKVRIDGPGKHQAVCMEVNEFTVDTSKAGFGGLSVSVQGPSKAELTCKEEKAGLIKVNYKPMEPGTYTIAVKFADEHVKESPLTVHCVGEGSGRVRQQIVRKADQALISMPDQEATMYLKLPNTSSLDVSAKVMDPKGRTEPVEIVDLGDQYYQIKFHPRMEGSHALSVLHKSHHVNGSPFIFTVGSFGEGGAHKVRASGTGVIRGVANAIESFNVYSREAGPGTLAVSVEGPSKAELEFKDHKDGNCHVDYKVSAPGEYLVSIKFNDVHIPDSPHKVFIAPSGDEVHNLKLESFKGDEAVPVGAQFSFNVLTHRARGELDAKVIAPNGDVETVDIVRLDDGEGYALRFVPKQAGFYQVHVTLDRVPMRDSPFLIRVGSTGVCDPTAVCLHRDNLTATTGQTSEFLISTVNAGAGVLTVKVDGPSKVTLDAYELDHGYKVRLTPFAPGDYYATVKYNGIHIPGSPFRIPVEGRSLGGSGYNESSIVRIEAPAKSPRENGHSSRLPDLKGDASKVVVHGSGLSSFVPGRPANFTIDTSNAGPHLLFVGVVTSEGPCEEVLVKHQGGGHYLVTYKVPKHVRGSIFVRYGDQDIPGSPFTIEP